MLKRLLTGRSSPRHPPAPPRIPPGQRVFAIGDIHGRLDLLEDLLARIAADVAQRPPARTQLIFLGDVIDRGPHSAGVIERLLALADNDADARFLLGNHEEVFLSVLDGNYDALRFFNRIGGDATIASYGIGPADFAADDFFEVLDVLRNTVPPRHVAFLKTFEDRIVIGDYAFVHAGIRPGVALADQKAEDLRWIRAEFLGSNRVFEKHIVHGHTVTDDADMQHNRTGLDTGAYMSGRLTAMGFEADQRWVVQAGTRAAAAL